MFVVFRLGFPFTFEKNIFLRACLILEQTSIYQRHSQRCDMSGQIWQNWRLVYEQEIDEADASAYCEDVSKKRYTEVLCDRMS